MHDYPVSPDHDLTTLIRERDRARDRVAALEGQVAAVRALADTWDTEFRREFPLLLGFNDRHARELRAALDPDPADRGTGRDGGGS